MKALNCDLKLHLMQSCTLDRIVHQKVMITYSLLSLFLISILWNIECICAKTYSCRNASPLNWCVKMIFYETIKVLKRSILGVCWNCIPNWIIYLNYTFFTHTLRKRRIMTTITSYGEKCSNEIFSIWSNGRGWTEKSFMQISLVQKFLDFSHVSLFPTKLLGNKSILRYRTFKSFDELSQVITSRLKVIR